MPKRSHPKIPAAFAEPERAFADLPTSPAKPAAQNTEFMRLQRRLKIDALMGEVQNQLMKLGLEQTSIQIWEHRQAIKEGRAS